MAGVRSTQSNIHITVDPQKKKIHITYINLDNIYNWAINFKKKIQKIRDNVYFKTNSCNYKNNIVSNKIY